MTVVSTADWPLEGPRVIGLYGAFATENSYDAAVAAYPASDAPPVPKALGRSPGHGPPTVQKSVWKAAQRFVEVSTAVLGARCGPDVLRQLMSETAYQEFTQVRTLLANDGDRPGSARLSSVRMRTTERVEIVAMLRGARRDRALAAAQELRGGLWWCTRFQLV